MIIPWLAVMVACAVLFSGIPESMAVHEYFQSIDVDTDGKITEREFSADMKGHAFHRLDTDKNEVISMQEWERVDMVRNREKHMELFESMDRDRDRRISFFEFSDYAERHSNIEEAFMGLDKDRNNSLTPDELTVRPLFKMVTISF